MDRFLLEGGNWIVLLILLDAIGIYFFLNKLVSLFANPVNKSSLNVCSSSFDDADWDQLCKEQNKLKGAKKRLFTTILEELRSERSLGFLKTRAVLAQEVQKIEKGTGRVQFIGTLIFVSIIIKGALDAYLDPTFFSVGNSTQASFLLFAIFGAISALLFRLLGAILKASIRKKVIRLGEFVEQLTSTTQ